jgi:hypothetical protein
MVALNVVNNDASQPPRLIVSRIEADSLALGCHHPQSKRSHFKVVRIGRRTVSERPQINQDLCRLVKARGGARRKRSRIRDFQAELAGPEAKRRTTGLAELA